MIVPAHRASPPPFVLTSVPVCGAPCRGGSAAMAADAPGTWSVVIPVKVLARAKSRLTGLAGARRPELALALAADTVAAAVGCPEVAAVIVVSDDQAASAALAGPGAGARRRRGLRTPPGGRHRRARGGPARPAASRAGTGAARRRPLARGVRAGRGRVRHDAVHGGRRDQVPAQV